MPMSALPPNPSLVAILLLVKSRAGPSFVFHYPPLPDENGTSSQATPFADDESVPPSESDEDWSSDDGYYGDEDHKIYRRPSRVKRRNSEEGKDAGNQGKREWETVLGYSTDGLAKVLCPNNRTWDKKKFEFGMGNLVFLGCPMFARDDGSWRKRKEEGKRRNNNKTVSSASSNNGEIADHGKEATRSKPNHLSNDAEHQTSPTLGKESERDDSGLGVEDSTPSSQSLSGTPHRTGTRTKPNTSHDMSMFHIVYVLNPPLQEHQLRVKEMYDNVAKKFSKVLKFQQARSNYVWTEAQKILAAKERAKESNTPISSLWSTIISSSTLAKSIAVIYEAISLSRIAQLDIDDTFETCFQIPQPVSTPYVPTPTEPQVPGLWLTTAHMTDEDDSEAALSPYAALLLLSDTDELLREIESDPKELSAALAYFIRNLMPTKSLLHHATRMSVSLPDIQFLARHLIYWRRARAIPPLHVQNIYIVSPNADLRQLKLAISAYAARFPTLPSLPKMLKALSRPVPYGLLPPSKDHRPAYFEILAWLFRNGWVTQLRGFAWVRVSAEVKVAVAEEVKKDGDKSVLDEATTDSNRTSQSMLHTAVQIGSAEPVANETSPSNISSHEPAFEPPSAGRGQPFQKASPPRKEAPNTTDANSPPHLLAPSLILSPQKASALEKRWLAHIASTFTTSTSTTPKPAPSPAPTPPSPKVPSLPPPLEDEEELLKTHWPAFVKYFDGRHPLDEIGAREGVKRKVVKRVVDALEARGLLVIVRHW